MGTTLGDFDPPLVLPRELHRQCMTGIEGVTLVVRKAREALGNAVIDLRRTDRMWCEGGGAPGLVQPAVDAARAASDDLLSRQEALNELAKQVRACDQDLTPVRPPAETARKAFESSQRFAAIKCCPDCGQPLSVVRHSSCGGTRP